MRQDSQCGVMSVVFLAGMATGAVAALVLAPHSGAYTRRQLQNLAEDVKESASGLAADAKEAVEDVMDQGKRIVS
jgi:gas vesicle protein